MTSIAAHERALLCTLAQQVGPDAPTLCGGWDVRALVSHLLVREGSPAAVGIVVAPLAGFAERAMARSSARDFGAQVGRLRSGPPRLSPFSLPKVDATVNLVEMYVHHEDIRRAQPGWGPRTLPTTTEDALWKSLRVAGRGFTASSPVGVVARRSDTEETLTLHKGDRVVELVGLPSEITLFAAGRKDQARVETTGDPDDVAALRAAALGG